MTFGGTLNYNAKSDFIYFQCQVITLARIRKRNAKEL